MVFSPNHLGAHPTWAAPSVCRLHKLGDFNYHIQTHDHGVLVWVIPLECHGLHLD